MTYVIARCFRSCQKMIIINRCINKKNEFESTEPFKTVQVEVNLSVGFLGHDSEDGGIDGRVIGDLCTVGRTQEPRQARSAATARHRDHNLRRARLTTPHKSCFNRQLHHSQYIIHS